ncbi:MAG: RusA family crossover junction endodeoxyribonuclease [Hyphomonadaceae bacterium]
MFDGVDELEWRGGAKVRWAREGAAFLLRLDEVTTQSRVYKQRLDHFFRHECRDWRPRWGDFSVEILLEVREGLPPVDLDNLAKAILDGVKGALFFDDVQVARLLVERRTAAGERITVRVAPRAG